MTEVEELIGSLWVQLEEGEYTEGYVEDTLYCFVYTGERDNARMSFEFVIARSDIDSSLNTLGLNCKFDYTIKPEYTAKAKDLIFRLNDHLDLSSLSLNDEKEVYLYYPLIIIEGTEPEALLKTITDLRSFMAAVVHGYRPAFVCMQEKGMSPQEAENIVVSKGYNA